MKKIITLLCVAVFSIASIPSFAQVKLGLKAGINANSLSYNYEDSDEEEGLKDATDPKIGYTVGLAAEFSFSEVVSLQTGLMLASKGAKLKEEENGFSMKAKTTLNYLEIPLNLAFKISNFQIHAGPYVGIGLFGKSKAEYTIGNESESSETKLRFKNKISDSDQNDLKDDEDFVKRTDFGLNLGAGYRVGSVLLTATYSQGFSNLNPDYEDEDDDDEDKVMNKGLSLAATWFF